MLCCVVLCCVVGYYGYINTFTSTEVVGGCMFLLGVTVRYHKNDQVTDLQMEESSRMVDYVRRMSIEENIAQPHPIWHLTGSAGDLTGSAGDLTGEIVMPPPEMMEMMVVMIQTQKPPCLLWCCWVSIMGQTSTI